MLARKITKAMSCPFFFQLENEQSDCNSAVIRAVANFTIIVNRQYCSIFDFRPQDKGEPSNTEKAMCKRCPKEVPVKSATLD